MKKLLTVLLITVLAAVLFTACDTDKDTRPRPTNEQKLAVYDMIKRHEIIIRLFNAVPQAQETDIVKLINEELHDEDFIRDVTYGIQLVCDETGTNEITSDILDEVLLDLDPLKGADFFFAAEASGTIESDTVYDLNCEISMQVARGRSTYVAQDTDFLAEVRIVRNGDKSPTYTYTKVFLDGVEYEPTSFNSSK